MIDKCFSEAKQLLKDNATSRGVIAGRQYYNDVWGRDGMITSLGMSCSGDEKLVSLSKITIDAISKFQRNTGQLPNKFDPHGKKLCFGEGGCVDTSLWYPIAVLNHFRNTDDKAFAKKHIDKIEKAIFWASCLDQNGDNLIETNEGSDWMDLLIRSGRVLYDQVVYYKALTATDDILQILGRKKKYSVQARDVKEEINNFFWPEVKNLSKIQKRYGHTGIEKDFETVLGAGEKDHYFAEIGFRRYDARFDTYANILAILFGVSDRKKSERIIESIRNRGIDYPYPLRVLDPPIYENDFFRPFNFRWTELGYLQEPGNYHNGGIWPLAGGFYIIALKKLGKDWKDPLLRLAQANRLSNSTDWGFYEWMNAAGEPKGSKHQSWSAGMYIFAYQFAKGKVKI